MQLGAPQLGARGQGWADPQSECRQLQSSRQGPALLLTAVVAMTFSGVHSRRQQLTSQQVGLQCLTAGLLGSRPAWCCCGMCSPAQQ